jgi:thiol-disulfide isomerase/thioredoxin
MTEIKNQNSSTSSGSKLKNIFVAVAAIALAIALFLGLGKETGVASLETQAKQSTPLEIALSNSKPTLTEFYANWCTTCQAMAKDLAQLKKDYHQTVNFVMLNVDNSKWLPEVLKYRVDGIPHFIFIDAQGETIGETIGEQPLNIFRSNLDALIANQELPYSYTSGRVSDFEAPVSSGGSNQNDPRSHGAQVKS